ncbi:GNAT family N-acetyltransferase [Aliikangiella maris]|uniref:GNAT family N-acetyltransferase n=2 Tax=Aliikangiella maris TaxID=3162458 RepID=A0ABV2BTM2_9GAMM
MNKPSQQNQSDILICTAQKNDGLFISRLITPLVKKFICPDLTAKAQVTMLNSVCPQQIYENIEDGFCYFLARPWPAPTFDLPTQSEVQAESTHSTDTLYGVIGIKDNMHLYHLFVDEDLHHRQIATRLWQHYLAQLNLTTLDKPRNITVNSSKYALGFYQKLGFHWHGQTDQRHGIISYPMSFDTLTHSN